MKEKIMKEKILLMLIALAILTIPTSALNQQGSATSPATISVNYFVASNTNFWVNTSDPSQTMLNFTTRRIQNDVQPEGQNSSVNSPWATIQNVGDVSQTFKAKLGSANPSGLSLYLSNNSDYSGQVLVNPTTAVGPTAWSNVAPGGLVAAYFRLNASGATDGTYTNALQISSS